MVRKRLLAAAMLLAAATCCPANATNVGGYDNGISFTPTVQNAAYSSGQAMGGLQTVQVFRTSVYSAWIFDSFQITSKSGQTVAMTIYTYDTKPTGTCTD